MLWWDTAPTWSDKYGSTLFMVMAEHGEAATVDVLLDDKAGADRSIVDNESIPALLWRRKSSRCVNGYGSASRKKEHKYIDIPTLCRAPDRLRADARAIADERPAPLSRTARAT